MKNRMKKTHMDITRVEDAHNLLNHLNIVKGITPAEWVSWERKDIRTSNECFTRKVLKR